MTEKPGSRLNYLNIIASRAFEALPVMGRSWKEHPGTLWHYADASAALSIIQRQELWATNALFMNDKSELRIIHDIFKSLLEGGTTTLVGDEWKQFCDGFWEFLNPVNDDPGIYAVCFCEDGDLLSQWRSYGIQGGGYALGFDAQKLAEIEEDIIDAPELFPVLYDPATQRDAARKVLDIALDLLAERLQQGDDTRDEAIDGVGRGLGSVAQWLGFRFKHPAFAEEREWRLVYRHFPGILDMSVERHFRTAALGLIPYLKFPLRPARAGAEGENMPLTAVRVGPTATEDLSKRSMDYLLEQCGFEVRAELSSIPLRA